MGGLSVVILLLIWIIAFGVIMAIINIAIDALCLGIIGFFGVAASFIMLCVNKIKAKKGGQEGGLHKVFLKYGALCMFPLLVVLSLGLGTYINIALLNTMIGDETQNAEINEEIIETPSAVNVESDS